MMTGRNDLTPNKLLEELVGLARDPGGIGEKTAKAVLRSTLTTTNRPRRGKRYPGPTLREFG